MANDEQPIKSLKGTYPPGEKPAGNVNSRTGLPLQPGEAEWVVNGVPMTDKEVQDELQKTTRLQSDDHLPSPAAPVTEITQAGHDAKHGTGAVINEMGVKLPETGSTVTAADAATVNPAAVALTGTTPSQPITPTVADAGEEQPAATLPPEPDASAAKPDIKKPDLKLVPPDPAAARTEILKAAFTEGMEEKVAKDPATIKTAANFAEQVLKFETEAAKHASGHVLDAEALKKAAKTYRELPAVQAAARLGDEAKLAQERVAAALERVQKGPHSTAASIATRFKLTDFGEQTKGKLAHQYGLWLDKSVEEKLKASTTPEEEKIGLTNASNSLKDTKIRKAATDFLAETHHDAVHVPRKVSLASHTLEHDFAEALIQQEKAKLGEAALAPMTKALVEPHVEPIKTLAGLLKEKGFLARLGQRMEPLAYDAAGDFSMWRAGGTAAGGVVAVTGGALALNKWTARHHTADNIAAMTPPPPAGDKPWVERTQADPAVVPTRGPG